VVVCVFFLGHVCLLSIVILFVFFPGAVRLYTVFWGCNWSTLNQHVLPVPTTAATAATLSGEKGDVRGGGGTGAARLCHRNAECRQRALLECPCAAPCGATRGATATALRRPRLRWGGPRRRHCAVRVRRTAPRLSPRRPRGTVLARPAGAACGRSFGCARLPVRALHCAVLIEDTGVQYSDENIRSNLSASSSDRLTTAMKIENLQLCTRFHIADRICSSWHTELAHQIFPETFNARQLDLVSRGRASSRLDTSPSSGAKLDQR